MSDTTAARAVARRGLRLGSAHAARGAAALNAGGVSTTWSCCGHGEQQGRIGLSDGRELTIAVPENGDADSDETATDALHRVAETADALKAAGLRVRVDVTLTVTMPPETPENGERPHTHTRGIDRGDCPECAVEYGEQL